jgi:hypothetical protein
MAERFLQNEKPKSIIDSLEVDNSDVAYGPQASVARAAVLRSFEQSARHDNEEEWMKAFFAEFVEWIRRYREEDDQAERAKAIGSSSKVREKTEEILERRRHNRPSPEEAAVKLIARTLVQFAGDSNNKRRFEMWERAVPALASDDRLHAYD